MLFMGYITGRRIGRREGAAEEAAWAPLNIRRASWEQGTCLVCGTTAGSSFTKDDSQPANDE